MFYGCSTATPALFPFFFFSFYCRVSLLVSTNYPRHFPESPYHRLFFGRELVEEELDLLVPSCRIWTRSGGSIHENLPTHQCHSNANKYNSNLSTTWAGPSCACRIPGYPVTTCPRRPILFYFIYLPRPGRPGPLPGQPPTHQPCFYTREPASMAMNTRIASRPHILKPPPRT